MTWTVRCFADGCGYLQDFDRQPAWWPRCPRCGGDIEQQLAARERAAVAGEALGRAIGRLRWQTAR